MGILQILGRPTADDKRQMKIVRDNWSKHLASFSDRETVQSIPVVRVVVEELAGGVFAYHVIARQDDRAIGTLIGKRIIYGPLN